MKSQNGGRKFRLADGLAMLMVFAMVGCKPQTIAASTVEPTNTLIAFTPTALPVEIIDAKGVVMRLVPAGPFRMGSSDGMPDEKPVHTVDLPAFYMDKYEVTNALYRACVYAGVCLEPVNTGSGVHSTEYGNRQFDNYPVTRVYWDRAETYCEWRGARLPKETEWEKAARGNDERKYPWGNAIDPTFANYGSNVSDNDGKVFGKITAVGSYPKGQSPYGIYDMAGNVWEWAADWYDMYPGGDPSANIAFGQKTYRVLRGGGWNDDPDLLRTAFRGGNIPNTALNYIGFRCVRTP